MASGGDSFLSRLIRNRTQSRWDGIGRDAGDMPLTDLRRNVGDARRLRRSLDVFLIAAQPRLLGNHAEPVVTDAPLGTDVVWRPDVWRTPVTPSGAVAAESAAALSPEVTLYHDCPLCEQIVHQLPSTDDNALAPYSVRIEVMGFTGSFLSLAIPLPGQLIEGLRRDHVVRLLIGAERERPMQIYTRLNVRHGPNIADLLRAVPSASGGYAVVDFDMYESDINEKRVESGWLDVIFEMPQMNAVTLTDIVMLRYPRADL